jgi:hypothetical protein
MLLPLWILKLWNITILQPEANNKYLLAISIYLPIIGPNIFLLKPRANNIEKGIDNLWKDVFTYLIKHFNGVIFVHNLGSFDGFFIYKHLSNFAKPDKVSTIIDDKNKFIQISYNDDII